jgi:hypothetical protein
MILHNLHEEREKRLFHVCWCYWEGALFGCNENKDEIEDIQLQRIIHYKKCLNVSVRTSFSQIRIYIIRIIIGRVRIVVCSSY